MSQHTQPNEAEQDEVMAWAVNQVASGQTDFEDGTYEEGVLDTLRWMRGTIDSRPDQP